MAPLDGKTAIVTGASSGIGAATAQALARDGARVIGGARRPQLVAAPVEGRELDVTDPASSERFVASAAGHGIDILVNGAGLALGREPFDAPEKLKQLYRAHDFGAYATPDGQNVPVDFLSTTDIIGESLPPAGVGYRRSAGNS